MRSDSIRLLLPLLVFAVPACAAPGEEGGRDGSVSGAAIMRTEDRPACRDATPHRQALFGDLHVHTSFSFDAAANSTGATPADAYRFAKGEAIPFWPIGEDGSPEGSITIDRPLDFVAVTDHGEFLGERRLCRDPESPRYGSEFCTTFRSDQRVGMQMLGAVITTETPRRTEELCGEDGSLCREWAMSPWQEIIEAAEDAYDRTEACSFTTFVGYEYTGTPGISNYHRNVVFRSADVPELPVSYIDAPTDSLLWQRLDEVCGDGSARPGCDYLTIPHNSNLANGRMAPYRGLDGTLEARRAYAEKRLEREPIVEIFQHKGGSECINGLSSVFAEPDELCDVEAVRVLGREETVQSLLSGETTLRTEECPEGENGNQGMLGAGCVDKTDFVRSALVVGLDEEMETGLNPVKLGFIASTDTHTATPGAVAEEDWRGAVSVEATPGERLQPGLLTSGIDGNAGGLAGVWAVENSRDAIFEAMERREVFGTSGPRIRPRFFGGWGYAENLCDRTDLLEQAYAGGVPMGGDLPEAGDGAAPTFLAFAARDPADGAGLLQQLQLVKGWIDADGTGRTQVIPIAGSPDNGASVDPATGERSGDGHDSLCTVYRDEAFDAGRHAYYYLRVVENPSLRWSWYDCRRLAPEDRPAVCSDGSYPATIQEMAWTSPIWYRPANTSEEPALGESLVARGQEHELDTVRVPPPGDFIEHEAAGFAKVLCSAVFLTGLDFEDAWTQIGGFTSRHQYRDRLPGRVLDRENQRVHVTTDTDVTRTAVLHGDQGCVALPKGEDAPFYATVPVTSTLDENAPWPMGDALPDEPLPDDVDAEKLAAAVDAAFDGDAMTLAFVVLHRGRLVAERYREGIDKDTPLESWSMNKSLSATLMGVLIEQGEYTLDQLAPVDSWHEDPDDVRGTIRIQDILRMSSGLRCVNAGDPEYDGAAMGYPDHLYLYTGTVNSHLWATERQPQWPPNTIGRYRNCDPILTNHLVRLAVEGRGQNYHEFPQKHLFDRIGVRRFVAEADPYGNFLLNGYGFGSARTWARLGQLYLDDGVAPTGERVLPEGFVEFVSTPAPAWVADGRPLYGGFFWINNPPRGGVKRYPSLPNGAFSMQGAGGQSTIIVPSHEMVVVRLGLYEGSFGGHAEAALQSALALLVEAVPEGG